jgi:hypothetical protein
MTQVNPDLKRRYDNAMSNERTKYILEDLKVYYPVLCQVDNNFAYNYSQGNKYKIFENSKHCNFVPTYDKWCLYCDDREKEKKKCSRCKSVFFCDEKCQRNAWKIHKQHCGRDLFQHCIQCGVSITEYHKTQSWHKCERCPVKFCSEKCRGQIYNQHREFDCDYFSETFA